MRSSNVIDLCSDEETERKNDRPELLTNYVSEKVGAGKENCYLKFGEYGKQLGFQQNIISNEASFGFLPPSNPCAFSDSVPLCRKFWNAGEYGAVSAPGRLSQNGRNRLRVHPEFLHSNATSHKWVFGAIAELLDNAVDEVQSGATFVIIDKFKDPRDGNNALLIQDDGGGMDPQSLRHCMSFGFSYKQSESSIGKYGNGFKTSSMRLGADVIVLSRHMNERTFTQSVGLLSYTFLRHTFSDDIIVPMVDYEFSSNGGFRRLLHHDGIQFSSNLSAILKWSPFATEVELLKQFNDIGHHGTKIIVFNLWFSDDGHMELDFESDAEDILVNGAPQNMLGEKHIGSRFRYSLRAYSSILYLLLPENFRIILRGQVVEARHIADDLQYPECIKYKPHNVRDTEVIIAVGFSKGAPKLNLHGFSIYHHNRLILPYWPVFSQTSGKGRGVSGVLEANFIKPTHDKQDFERSSLFHKLEVRLKEITLEYWNYHCHLVGYQPVKKNFTSTPSPATTDAHRTPNSSNFNGANIVNSHDSTHQLISAARVAHVGGASLDPLCNYSHHSSSQQVDTALSAPTYVAPGKFFTDCTENSQTRLLEKRRYENDTAIVGTLKKQAVAGGVAAGPENNHNENCGSSVRQQKQEIILQQNVKYRAECSEYEDTVKQLSLKAQKLEREIQECKKAYDMLQDELKSMEEVKMELEMGRFYL